jgi:hypothetical protein
LVAADQHAVFADQRDKLGLLTHHAWQWRFGRPDCTVEQPIKMPAKRKQEATTVTGT